MKTVKSDLSSPSTQRQQSISRSFAPPLKEKQQRKSFSSALQTLKVLWESGSLGGGQCCVINHLPRSLHTPTDPAASTATCWFICRSVFDLLNCSCCGLLSCATQSNCQFKNSFTLLDTVRGYGQMIINGPNGLLMTQAELLHEECHEGGILYEQLHFSGVCEELIWLVNLTAEGPALSLRLGFLRHWKSPFLPVCQRNKVKQILLLLML